MALRMPGPAHAECVRMGREPRLPRSVPTRPAWLGAGARCGSRPWCPYARPEAREPLAPLRHVYPALRGASLDPYGCVSTKRRQNSHRSPAAPSPLSASRLRVPRRVWGWKGRGRNVGGGPYRHASSSWILDARRLASPMPGRLRLEATEIHEPRGRRSAVVLRITGTRHTMGVTPVGNARGGRGDVNSGTRSDRR
jgi:hypothetical protein